MAVSSTRGRRVRRKEKKGLFAHLKKPWVHKSPCSLHHGISCRWFGRRLLSLGTACSIVLARIVDKSRAENTSADGEGIKYAAAKANRFVANTSDLGSVDSPSI